jgi:hypothetical protein
MAISTTDTGTAVRACPCVHRDIADDAGHATKRPDTRPPTCHVGSLDSSPSRMCRTRARCLSVLSATLVVAAEARTRTLSTVYVDTRSRDSCGGSARARW